MIEGREYLFVAPIDGKSDTPLYLQLKQQIKKLIIDGTLRPGDSLPSETEYCEYHNISRTTVRQAFSELEKEGCVTRIKGKGTFISEPKLSRTLNSLYSFSAEMARMGLKADAQIISFQTITGDTELIQRFQLQNEDPHLFQIIRLRTVNDEPLTIETVYIPCSVCPQLNQEILNNYSLYKVLKQYAGITPAHAKEVYAATLIRKEEAKLLNCPAGSSAFLVERTSFDFNERIFEIAKIVARGDRWRYELERQAEGISFQQQID
ncbi:GntR family transcriptional regulator [bacterium 1XD21-13]|nr:GntR family transcriptional regulator [bacterium 1XD21-13]